MKKYLLCLFAALALVFSQAHATGTVQPIPNYLVDPGYGVPYSYGSTKEAACQGAVAWMNANWGGSRSAYVTGNTCNISSLGSFGIADYGTACPANSTAAGAACSCNAGYDAVGGSCVLHVVDPAEVCAGLNANDAVLTGAGAPRLTVTYGGVQVTGSGSAGGKKGGSFTGFSLFGPFKCSPLPSGLPVADTGAPVAPPSTPAPSTCSGYWGAVNGVDTCIPKQPKTGFTGATGGTVSDSTASNPAGAASGTSSGTTGTKETVCDGDSCTTTTKTTSSDGTQQTTEKTEPQADFCSANPASPLCSNDPCKDNPDSMGCSKFGDVDASGALPQLNSGFAGITPVSFASSASCPGDLTINYLAGKTVTFSYAGTCTTLANIVRPILLVLSVGFAAFVFVGGFKS